MTLCHKIYRSARDSELVQEGPQEMLEDLGRNDAVFEMPPK